MSEQTQWPVKHESTHDPLVMWFDCDTCDDLLDLVPDDDARVAWDCDKHVHP